MEFPPIFRGFSDFRFFSGWIFGSRIFFYFLFYEIWILEFFFRILFLAAQMVFWIFWMNFGSTIFPGETFPWFFKIFGLWDFFFINFGFWVFWNLWASGFFLDNFFFCFFQDFWILEFLKIFLGFRASGFFLFFLKFWRSNFLILKPKNSEFLSFKIFFDEFWVPGFFGICGFQDFFWPNYWL